VVLAKHKPRLSYYGKRVTLALIAPLLFLGVVEIALIGFGVRPLSDTVDLSAGFSSTARVFEAEEGRGVFATVDRAAQQSFSRQEFMLRKPASGFRLFTLGGSSALGFPWGAEQAFTHLLTKVLQAAYPGRVVEGVNASAMSYASHRMSLLTHELRNYEPDLFILYEGHNEFIERSFYEAQNRALSSAGNGILGEWRLFALAQQLKPRSDQPPPGTTAELLGFDVVREKRIFANDADRAPVIETFETNYRNIIHLARRQGAQVVLCTVPSNVRDWRPNLAVLDETLDQQTRDKFIAYRAQSEKARAVGRDGEAVQALEQARETDPNHAGVHFELGRAYETLGRLDEARASYVRARDTDAQPSRGISAFNDIIRRLAEEEQLLLVDAERLFVAASPNGLIGFNLVEDYVHPKPEGHAIIARELAAVILNGGLLGESKQLDQQLFDAAVSRDAASAVADPSREAAMLYNTGYVLASQGHFEQAMDKYRACLSKNPFYTAAQLNLGVLLYGSGRPQEALEQFDAVLNLQPKHQQAKVSKAWALMTLGSYAVEVFRDATQSDPSDPQAFNGFGVALQRQARDLVGAANAFKRAVELEPRHPDAWCNLGETELRMNRLEPALRSFQKCAGLRPEHGATRAWLGWALELSGDRATAKTEYTAALLFEPENQYARQGLDRIESGLPVPAWP
jgi:tetratricopeptide (TPR) repeat protein